MAKKKDQFDVSEGAQNVPAEESQSQVTDRKASGSPEPDAQSGEFAQPADEADRLKVLETENAELKDKLLRKQADFENFRKRMFREREDAVRYANASLLTDIIGLIDDFERAIRSAEESRDFTSFLQGVSMIEKQLVEMLESRWGLRRFASVGESFDPNKHEAVLRVEGPSDAKPTVVEDYQKGYFLHERVLRPARVKVMVPAAEQAPPQPGGNGSPQPRDEGGVSPDGT